MYYEKAKPGRPWVAPQAVSWLDAHLDTSMRGLEYGSGRSTVWFANRLSELISIEDAPEWYDKVKETLIETETENVTYLLKESTPDTTGTIPYVEQIKSYDPETFDFIVVDGKFRDKIALEAICRLKSKGLLLLDDAERYVPLDTQAPYSYLKTEKTLGSLWVDFAKKTENWEYLHFSSGVSDTVIYIKP